LVKPPPWTGDDEGMHAFVNAELDELDAADLHNAIPSKPAPWVRRFARWRRERGSAGALRTEPEILGGRGWVESLAMDWNDVATLRRLNPQLAQFINLPRPGRGPRKKFIRDPLSAECRLEEATADVRSIRTIWKKYYSRSNRPRGELTAEKIAAARWGLTEDDVNKRRVSRATRQALNGPYVKRMEPDADFMADFDEPVSFLLLLADGIVDLKTFPGKFGSFAG
jgi:hypothetical protein